MIIASIEPFDSELHTSLFDFDPFSSVQEGLTPQKEKKEKKGKKMIFTASAVLDVTGDHCSPDSAVSAVIC